LAKRERKFSRSFGVRRRQRLERTQLLSHELNCGLSPVTQGGVVWF
jgi:hypothetical protein